MYGEPQPDNKMVFDEMKRKQSLKFSELFN